MIPKPKRSMKTMRKMVVSSRFLGLIMSAIVRLRENDCQRELMEEWFLLKMWAYGEKENI